MDFILEQLVTWWQFTLVGILIIIGWVINAFDEKKPKLRIGFFYEEMPKMQPVPIRTRDKGFWGAVWLWLMGTRQWVIAEDFKYQMNGIDMVIPKGFQFDGASIPKFLHTWLSPTGVLLMGGLIHDYGYKYQTLLKADKKTTIGIKDQKWMDQTFRDINIEINGFVLLNYLAYYALRLGGFVAWNGHRKVGATIHIET